MKRDWLPLPWVKHMAEIVGLDRFADAIGEAFKATGEELLDELKGADLLREGDRVLELGCGCGRFARVLVDEPIASYVGFDENGEMVEWCRGEISQRDPRFDFRELRLVYDEAEDGSLSFRGPFEDDAFDFVLIEALFGGMPFGEALAYVAELGRVVAPGGRVVFSVFFAVGETYSHGLPPQYFYAPKDLWTAAEAAGFDHAVRGTQTTGGIRNWVVLTARGQPAPA